MIKEGRKEGNTIKNTEFQEQGEGREGRKEVLQGMKNERRGLGDKAGKDEKEGRKRG